MRLPEQHIIDSLRPPRIVFGVGRPHSGGLPMELVVVLETSTVSIISQVKGTGVKVALSNKEARQMAEVILREVRE